MKINVFISFLTFGLLFLSSCNRDEGFGGSSMLEGYVYNIVHYDDNLSFRKDTIPAVREDVFLIFGNNSTDYFGEDVETYQNGFYRIEYLRPGNYKVFAYSETADLVDPIFINTGKAYGTSIIKGTVFTTYYHNGVYRDRGPGTGMRAYIKHKGEEGYFDDTRVVDGAFYFQKVFPGDYEIAVETEDIITEAVRLIIKSVSVTETSVIVEIPETFMVNMSV